MSSQPTAHDAASEAMHKVGFGNFASLAGVDAVLAALGIPADTPTNDVSAAIVLLNAVHAGHLRIVGDASTPAVRAAIEHNEKASDA